MDVSPKTLREVEFREKMRGYHPEDVDQFLERVAAGIEVLQDRLRQAIERAQRAEQAANEAGGADDALRRTLLLAQRTADLAVSEGREQAARIIAVAEQQAQSMIAEAELRARQGHEDTVVEVRTEVTKLEARRQQLHADIDAMARWAEGQRHQLRVALEAAMAAVGHIEMSGPESQPPAAHYQEPMAPPPVAIGQPGPRMPSPVPVDQTRMAAPVAVDQPRIAAPVAMEQPAGYAPEPVQGSGQQAADGPLTLAWQPEDGDDTNSGTSDADPYFAELRRAISDQDPLGPRSGGAPPSSAGGATPPSDELTTPDFVEARRFGGRLRRRF